MHLTSTLPEVLETVINEIAQLGVAVQGSTEAERVADQFNAAAFELIVFGRGIPGTISERLKRTFSQQNPRVRFLDTFAPVAVGQIVAALDEKTKTAEVDLDAYCARIGYRGPRTPTIETLRALQELHPAAIVFENIDVMLGRSVDISPAAVDAKLIDGRRGGYCFEHNSLFKCVLTGIGFQVDGLVARVRWMAPPGAPPNPRTHMALRVTVDGQPWLADTGFGGCVPTSPLRMDTTEPQPTRHETYRIIPSGAGLLVQARIGDAWASLYELSQEPQLDVDYTLPNWFTATHPTSHFRRNLTAARTTPDARYSLMDRRLTIRTPEGNVEQRFLDASEIEQALRETFVLPVEASWQPVIEQAAMTSA